MGYGSWVMAHTEAYPCERGGWTQKSMGHGLRGRPLCLACFAGQLIDKMNLVNNHDAGASSLPERYLCTMLSKSVDARHGVWSELASLPNAYDNGIQPSLFEHAQDRTLIYLARPDKL